MGACVTMEMFLGYVAYTFTMSFDLCPWPEIFLPPFLSPFELATFFLSFLPGLYILLAPLHFLFLCNQSVPGKEKEGQETRSLLMPVQVLKMETLREVRKIRFSFSWYWTREPHLKWPTDPREAFLSNYLLIHWLDGMERGHQAGRFP